MLFSLLTAHIITDFVLQPDWMALAKKKRFSVLLLHGAITGLGALVVVWLYKPHLWIIAPILAISHLIVDWSKIHLDTRLKYPILISFAIDQLIHILAIMCVLFAFNTMEWHTLPGLLQALGGYTNPLLAYTFAYSTSIFFGYVLLKILLLNLPRNETTKQEHTWYKYIGMLERGLITTCMAFGQFLLVFAVIAARLLLEKTFFQKPGAGQRLGLEMAVNVTLAVSAGLILLP
jgi:hypothetical protein